MSTRKIHLRANKLTGDNYAFARCAARPASNGQVRRNTRATYQFMASEIVSFEEFAATPAKDRCAHCMDIGLQARNRQRKAKGLAPVATIFEGMANVAQ
jgi:hypothetical protein